MHNNVIIDERRRRPEHHARGGGRVHVGERHQHRGIEQLGDERRDERSVAVDRDDDSASPGLVNLTSDPRPAAGSPVVGAGKANPTGPAGFPFPNALWPPRFSSAAAGADSGRQRGGAAVRRGNRRRRVRAWRGDDGHGRRRGRRRRRGHWRGWSRRHRRCERRRRGRRDEWNERRGWRDGRDRRNRRQRLVFVGRMLVQCRRQLRASGAARVRCADAGRRAPSPFLKRRSRALRSGCAPVAPNAIRFSRGERRVNQCPCVNQSPCSGDDEGASGAVPRIVFSVRRSVGLTRW